jgi:hypothetical protein
MSAGQAGRRASVQNFRIEADVVPNEYRYRTPSFREAAAMRIRGRAHQFWPGKDGAPAVLTLPEDDKSVRPLVVRFKY